MDFFVKPWISDIVSTVQVQLSASPKFMSLSYCNKQNGPFIFENNLYRVRKTEQSGQKMKKEQIKLQNLTVRKV